MTDRETLQQDRNSLIKSLRETEATCLRLRGAIDYIDSKLAGLEASESLSDAPASAEPAINGTVDTAPAPV